MDLWGKPKVNQVHSIECKAARGSSHPATQQTSLLKQLPRSVTRFVHARQDTTNEWHWTVQDGLGTVRVETDNFVVVEGSI